MLRPYMFKMQNFAGMTATFEFPTPLVVFYGYNRTGKTNPIKAMKWLFKGIKQEMDKGKPLSAILGEGKEASLEMVFEFKGILYRLRRRLLASKERETISLTSSKIKGDAYLNTRAGIRDEVAFDKEKQEDIIAEVDIKLSGDNKNTSLLGEKLKAIGLYPQMIDRLIAIENIQEFKNATKRFGSKEGGGYAVVKDLLSQELKRMEIALKDMNDNEGDLAEKLKILEQTIVDGHGTLLQELNELVGKTTIQDPKAVKSIIGTLSLVDDPEGQLDKFRAALKSQDGKMKKTRDLVVGMLGLVPGKRDKYRAFEGHKNNLDLELVEAASTEFGDIAKSFKATRDALRICISIIETAPPSEEFDAPSFDTEHLSAEGFQGALSRNSLKSISSPEKLGQFQTIVDGIVESFNNAREFFQRMKELKEKYGVQAPLDVAVKQGECMSLLSKLKQPATLNSSELFPLVGHMEGGKIQVYMPVDKFIPHIGTRSFGVQGILLPHSTKDGGKIPEGVIKDIIDMLQGKIDELTELKTKFDGKEGEMTKLRTHLGALDEINKQLDADSQKVKDWDRKVGDAQTLAAAFLEKYLDRELDEKSFSTIKNALAEVQAVFVAELKGEMVAAFRDREDLITNLDAHEISLNEARKELDATIQVLDDIGSKVRDKQEAYKNWCRDVHVARILHGKVLPTMIAVNDQVLANINIDKIEDELMQSIIKHSQAFYQEITGEQYLVIEREGEPGEDIFLKTTLRRPNGPNIDLLDDAASGSEQASIALGIMVALATMFNAFVVIDETTDRFDYPTKIRFFKVIEKYSKDIFTMIVLKVDTNVKNLKEDFDIMRSTFPAAVIYQPRKANDGNMTVAKVERFEDLKLMDEAP